MCGKKSFITNPYCDGDLEVNGRSVLAARAVGNGIADLATFAGIMGMPAPVAANHFSLREREIAFTTKKERKASFERAVAKASADDIINIRVTCDATWQRRGHQSLYGVVVVASWETGKVLDVELLSKFCFECSKKQHLDPTSPKFLDWWDAHSAFCNCNYKGTSGGMEAEGALRIWERSILKYKIRYTQMIADGDSSTYSTIRDKAPYGKNHPVVKHECVSHVQKRMYNRLKSVKQRRHIGSDGKAIRMGGKGRLTDALMKKLQRYYGKAIRSNVGDATAMKRAVMAIFYHSVSTSANPLHFMCPAGSTSWCKFRRAEAKKEPLPSHIQTIPYEISKIVKPVFLELSKDELMERCVLGASQNQNESFNSTIWNRCPKTDFCSADVVGIAVDLAVIVSNDGQEALKGLLEQLHYHCSFTTSTFFKKQDDRLSGWPTTKAGN